MPIAHDVIRTGRVGKESFQLLSDLISARKSADPFAPVTVVVPSQYAGVFLRRALAAENGLLNVRFMILPRLAEYLGAPALAKENKTPLTPLVEFARIRHIASETGRDGPLTAVSQHSRLPGLLRRAFKDLSRLSQYDLGKLAETDDLRRQLVDWYLQFNMETKTSYVDEQLMQAAKEEICKKTVADVLRDIGYVIFYLPNNLTQTEANLVRSLVRFELASVVVGMIGEDEIDHETLSMINGILPVGENIWKHENTRTMPPVKLLSAPDSREEIRWLVRDIARRCDDGTPFYKIAVLYRQGEPYSTLVPTQLALAKVPVAGPNQAPLRATPSGRSLLGMLAALNTDLSRSEVMRWLSESPVKVLGDGQGTGGTLAEWENISRQAGIIKGIKQWRERLNSLKDELVQRIDISVRLEESTPARIQGLHRTVTSVESLLTFINDFSNRGTPPASDTWADLSKWIKGLLDSYSIADDLFPPEHKVSHERLLAVLDEFGALDTTSIPPTLDVFLEILDQVLETPSGRLGETGSGVFVAPVETIKGMAFDVVYLVGLCEGDFPTAPLLDSMLPYEVRQTIGDGSVLDSQETFRRKERRAFLTACFAGDEYILSYPRADGGSQRSRYPSPWFMDAITTLTGRSVSIGEIPLLGDVNWLDVIQSPVHSLSSVESLAPADIHDRDVASVSSWTTSGRRLDDHYLAPRGSILHSAVALGDSRASREVTKWDGDLSDTAGVGTVLKGGPLSATGLESWARCPFSYFLGHVLGLRALDSPEDILTISALDRGSLVHRILERLVGESINRDKQSANTVSLRQLVQSIAEEEFYKAEDKGVTGKPLLWAVVKDEILRDLFSFVDENKVWIDEHGLTPVWAEKSFGFERNDSLESLNIVLRDGTQLSFRGMIDRMDVNEDKNSLYVTDYKTGSSYPYKDMNTDPLDSGRRLQLPIYTLVARRAYPKVEIAYGTYWFVTARSSFERKIVNLAEVEERFKDVIEGISTGIQTGLFPANPGPPGRYGPENCSFCDFDSICPTSRGSLWNRKKDDPRLAAYTGLSAIPDDGDDK